MTETDAKTTTGICLYALAAREEAVIKRVITFSEAQGRHYGVAAIEEAGILVVSDDTDIGTEATNPVGCIVVRIADAGVTQPCDVLMQRPLLVTKVMRSLDEANNLLQALIAVEQSVQIEEPAELVEAAEPAVVATPAPVSGLYAQIMQGAAYVPPVAVVTVEPTEQPQSAKETVPVPEPTVEQVPEQLAEQVEVIASESIDQSESFTVATTVATIDVENTVAATDAEGFHHRALVVDDSAAIRKQLELELRMAGISADFAETGEQALEKVDQNDYDLIFLDIIMPGIDGYETCRQMRTRAALKKMPIIMLSAKTSPLDEVQGVIAGASTYLTKPVKSEQLQKTLKRVSMWLDNFQVSV